MRVLKTTVPENFDLFLIGDSHEGSALQHKSGYLKALEAVFTTKDALMIHMGDEMEAFWIDDPRYDPSTSEKTPLLQQEQVIKDLTPIAKSKKLLTILFGNHTHRLYAKVGNITESTCKALGVPYAGFSCVVEFRDKRGLQWKGFFTHGRKNIISTADDPVRRQANEALQLKRHLKNKFGDCVLMAKGHCHKLIVSKPTAELYLTTEETGKPKQHYTGSVPTGTQFIHPDHRWYVATGSFLRLYGEGVVGYGEYAEYDPVELGYAIVEVRDRKVVNVRKVTV